MLPVLVVLVVFLLHGAAARTPTEAQPCWLCENVEMGGTCGVAPEGSYTQAQVAGVGLDNVFSSLNMLEGFYIVGCKDDNFIDCEVFTEYVPQLSLHGSGEFDNTISSLRCVDNRQNSNTYGCGFFCELFS